MEGTKNGGTGALSADLAPRRDADALLRHAVVVVVRVTEDPHVCAGAEV